MFNEPLDCLVAKIDGYTTADRNVFKMEVVDAFNNAMNGRRMSIHVFELMANLPREINNFTFSEENGGLPLGGDVVSMARERLLATIEALRDEMRLCTAAGGLNQSNS